ncbi:MAG: Structural maintenance of chromosomes protein 3 [Ramalina farinacea]|uniref:Structural maintenance of chromosomes protein n=1 Tax=Ramalina farinacea TaxID=258253 RepID=A0AA43QM46_9LECA|nr:Structural maintenance of chromosomes protein 3 [Ramalina farinacea]
MTNSSGQEGTGAAVMSAFVEIIFDNSDDRFPTSKPELTLRRTIGMKKDEYTLDRKNATKSDVMNLLESAGFSRSNPYYIVPQGRVTALTNMKDGERLELLKEVAGTQVYEARRQESVKIMHETKNKREKIDELLDYIKERLAELEEEKEELKEYQEKDKERRCLQYTIDHREQEAIANELDNLEEQRQNGADTTDDSSERFVQGEKDLAEIDAQMSELKQQVEFLKLDKRQLEDERKEAAKARAKGELEVKNLSDGQSAAQQAKLQYESELKQLQESVKQHEDSLGELLPQYNSKVEEEATAKSELDSAESTRRRLYEKQGRNARFRNKKERDDWLREQINASYPQVAKIKAVRVQTAEDITELEKDIAESEAEIEELREQLEGRNQSEDAVQKEIEEAKSQRERLMDERKELWREDARLDTAISNAQSELRTAEKELSKTMDQNTSRGLTALRRIRERHNLPGVHGTLAELLEVNDKWRTAIEVTAGQSLFHCVVEDDETATRAIEILVKEKLGRLTFIPLNRVKPRRANVPNANDAIPMMSKLHFDPKYEKAFEQVFGQTIICPNLTVAGQYARSHGVNAVTMEGDRSDKKGAFTGGSIDNRHSRLQAVRNVTKWRDECDTHRTRSTEVKRTLERKDQEITQAVGSLQKIEQRRVQQENSYGPIRQEIRQRSSSLDNKRDNLDKKQRARSNIEANFRSLNEQQSAHEAEIASAFKKDLTEEEETTLENLNSTVQDLRRQYSELSSARSDLETQKSILEIELRENLRPRLDQLKSQDSDSRGGPSRRGGASSLKQAQTTFSHLTKTLASVETKLNETSIQMDNTTTSIATLTNQYTEILTAQSDIARTIEKHQKRMEKSIQKRRILSAQAGEVSARIRDLGILPHGALEKYEKTKSDQVVKRLHKVNEALKEYGHVNKKAFEQYNNFTTQRDTLTKRRAELDSSHSSIEELIQVLDQRKDEAIERTFKQVSREFAGVFEKLVPAGRGRLVIQRKADRSRASNGNGAAAAAADDDEGSDSEQEARGKHSVENYTGVGISVSFNSKHDDQQRIQQLSGGQKSLCALALVFAIQQCDPAPFYLFDEIDANLDAQYRTAVANMLQSISARASTQNGDAGEGEGIGGGQFICTTFRPEMLLVAEKCYGVRYLGNKSSSVVVVEKDEALKFVEGEKQ